MADTQNKKGLSQGKLSLLIIVMAVIIDQIIKLLVKTNMAIGDQIWVTKWFRILFIENNGMAFGMELFGKLFLSLFRIVAIVFFAWYIRKIAGKGFPTGYMVTVALIVGGAIGNLVDCMFYGMFFSPSTAGPDGVSQLVGIGQGYSSFLYGKVVDMFYFPLWTWPEWMPFVGGDVFFGPIFNFADSCVTCGTIAILLFYTKYVNMGIQYKEEKQDNEDEKQ